MVTKNGTKYTYDKTVRAVYIEDPDELFPQYLPYNRCEYSYIHGGKVYKEVVDDILDKDLLNKE